MTRGMKYTLEYRFQTKLPAPALIQDCEPMLLDTFGGCSFLAQERFKLFCFADRQEERLVGQEVLHLILCKIVSAMHAASAAAQGSHLVLLRMAVFFHVNVI